MWKLWLGIIVIISHCCFVVKTQSLIEVLVLSTFRLLGCLTRNSHLQFTRPGIKGITGWFLVLITSEKMRRPSILTSLEIFSGLSILWKPTSREFNVLLNMWTSLVLSIWKMICRRNTEIFWNKKKCYGTKSPKKKWFAMEIETRNSSIPRLWFEGSVTKFMVFLLNQASGTLSLSNIKPLDFIRIFSPRMSWCTLLISKFL